MRKLDLESNYYSKDELVYRIDRNINLNKFWEELMLKRRSNAIELPLLDQNNNKFWFVKTKKIEENMAFLNSNGVKDLFDIINPEVKQVVTLENLIDEAFNSSVIEGAFSTRKRTKELVEKGIQPQNKSEQMIINNYNALKYVLNNIDSEFTEDKILDIYNIVTYKTLSSEDEVEKYRTDFVGVWDTSQDKYTYLAPKYTEVQALMNSLIDFAQNFNMEPLLKASIIHFYFVYIHPFFDGNGRTARALSYMYLLQSGYEFFKYFSISTILQEERKKYYKSIENTEIYDSDMTYFIENNLEATVKSLQLMIDKYKKEYGFRIIKQTYEEKGIKFSERQLKCIKYMIKSNRLSIRINEYKTKYRVSYETARSELKELYDLGVFKKEKVGKLLVYTLKYQTLIK